MSDSDDKRDEASESTDEDLEESSGTSEEETDEEASDPSRTDESEGSEASDSEADGDEVSSSEDEGENEEDQDASEEDEEASDEEASDEEASEVSETSEASDDEIDGDEDSSDGEEETADTSEAEGDESDGDGDAEADDEDETDGDEAEEHETTSEAERDEADEDGSDEAAAEDAGGDDGGDGGDDGDGFDGHEPPEGAEPGDWDREDVHRNDRPGVAAIFEHPDQLLEAARRTRDSDYDEFDVFSPFPIHGMDEAMGLGRSWMPWVTFVAGFVGFLSAVAMEFGMMTFDWPMIIGGKPYASWPAFVPVMFELTVLIGGVTTGVVMLVTAGCFQRAQVIDEDLTDDRFALWISGDDPHYDVDEVVDFVRDFEPVTIKTFTDRR